MIPFRSDQFDHFNNAQPVNRHLVFLPQQQQQQIVQSPSLMYATPTHNFHQPYPGNLSIQQQPFMFIPTRPHPQQSWILPTLPSTATSIPTFIPSPPTTYHPIQPPLPPPQRSFNGGTNISQTSFNNGTSIPQPSFSGGTAISQSSFNSGNTVSQPSFGRGTGIPQPPFSGGTAVLKRKSYHLEESDFDLPPNFDNENTKELPSLMSIPTQSFNTNQQQNHFRPTNSRYIENNGPRLRFPLSTSLGSCISQSRESFNNQFLNPHWTNNDRNTYPIAPQLIQPTLNEQQQQVLTSQLFQKHQLISIDTLLKEPGRSQRSSQIIVFLRGLPGSGKSYVADLIKNEEELQSKGNNKPKILSIDNYFLNETQNETKDPKTGKITKTTVMKYEYDVQMEETYRRSLIKLVRKSIDDRFYPFLIVDQNNEQIEHFRDMVDYAEVNQFQVYFVELNNDSQICAQRNIHNRTLSDIEQIYKRWEQLPLRYEILDIRSLLQSDAIDEVEMDDAPLKTTEQNEIEEEESQITKKSKWEAMMETNPDRLDGLYQRRNLSSSSSSSPNEKRLNDSTINIDEQSNDNLSNFQSKKKKVRWADVEENVLHLHKKAVGFVVGQTEQDWQQMSDDYDPSQKLNQYKYI